MCVDLRAIGCPLGVYEKSQSGEREKKYAHMLNSTLTATERTLCCLLENCQTDKGIVVPKPLVRTVFPCLPEPPTTNIVRLGAQLCISVSLV